MTLRDVKIVQDKEHLGPGPGPDLFLTKAVEVLQR